MPSLPLPPTPSPPKAFLQCGGSTRIISVRCRSLQAPTPPAAIIRYSLGTKRAAAAAAARIGANPSCGTLCGFVMTQSAILSLRFCWLGRSVLLSGRRRRLPRVGTKGAQFWAVVCKWYGRCRGRRLLTLDLLDVSGHLDI